MAYIKTKFKIPLNSITKQYNYNQILTLFENQIPLLWLQKQYNRTITGEPREPVFTFENCECIEKGECKVIYMSEPFFNFLRYNFKQYRLK